MIICQQSQKRPSESATNVLSLHTLLSITQRQCKALSKLRQQSSNCIIYSLGTSINVKVWCTWWNQNKQKIGAIQKLCCLDRGGYSQSKQLIHVVKSCQRMAKKFLKLRSFLFETPQNPLLPIDNRCYTINHLILYSSISFHS